MSSHRFRRSDDRDWSSSHKYDRHRRDDSRDHSDHYYSRERPEHYYSSRSEKSRSKYRSRSRSPSYGSKSHSRHHRSRSRSPGYSSSSRHHDDHYSRSHRSKDRKDQLSESRSRRDSHEHPHSKAHSTSSGDKVDVSSSSKHQSSNPGNEYGSSISSYQNYESSESHDDSKSNPAILTEEDAELEEEKQRIQKETLKRLQKHLEKEGKQYPPPKPQASHPIFANDGSFLEMFKSMQGTLQQQQQQPTMVELQPKPVVPVKLATNPVVPLLPVKRRGAKILKTGIVQKQRVVEEAEEPAQSSDSWNAYLKEVKRYKTVTCSDDSMTRSLVK